MRTAAGADESARTIGIVPVLLSMIYRHVSPRTVDAQPGAARDVYIVTSMDWLVRIIHGFFIVVPVAMVLVLIL